MISKSRQTAMWCLLAGFCCWKAVAADEAVILGSSNGFSVRCLGKQANTKQIGAFALEFKGALLLASTLTIDGTVPSSVPPVDTVINTNGWQFRSLHSTTGRPGDFEIRRSALFVEPDLFVIVDDVRCGRPISAAYQINAPSAPKLDRAGNLSFEFERAGLTARWFLDESEDFSGWEDVVSNVNRSGSAIRLGTREPLTHFSNVIVLIPHVASEKRALAFKLLKSNTAIGARIHRDGLPTLVAFRTDFLGDELDLTGLKFRGPVAVDVFNPAIKNRRSNSYLRQRIEK